MPADPIPLDAARKRKRVVDPPPPERDTEQCPVIALGHNDGKFYFLNLAGEVRCLTATALGKRSELLALFVGQSAWLEREFPQKKTRTVTVAGETVTSDIEVGFNASDSSAFLMREAGAAGIYGPHVILRRPGIWADSKGRPAIHCGDKVLIDDTWHRAGQRIDGTVWVAGPPLPQPGDPCTRAVGESLQDDLQRLWNFRRDGGAIIVVGLIGTGLLGASAPWRGNGFVSGGIGSGKSMLVDAMRACAPVHHFTNDTSAAGVQGALNGHAMPIFIDEASDRADQSGVQKLMDLVLAASRGEGVKGHRGTVDGGFRMIEMAGSLLYGSVAPPELQPQHLARITLIDLEQPGAGADHRSAMEALIERMKTHAAGLWGRMIASWEHWMQAVAVYREALAKAGCTPREMDQMSSILAGWWCLTEDGVPSQRDGWIGVAAIRAFVRTADDVADDDGPRRVVQHLLGHQIQYDGSTRKEQIGLLLETSLRAPMLNEPDAERLTAIKTLARHGMRTVREIQRGDRPPIKPEPRLTDGHGVWLAPSVIRSLFEGTRWEGDRWRTELLRLPGARGPSKGNVRIGGVNNKSIWVKWSEMQLAEPVSLAELASAVALPMTRLLVLIDVHGTRFPRVQEGRDIAENWLFDVAAVTDFLVTLSEIKRPEENSE